MHTPIEPSQTGTSPAHAATASWIARPRACWNACAEWLERWLGHELLALVSRVAMAAMFLQSGRTKVTGLLTVGDGTYALFREEYRIPLLPPELAAHLATYAEHLFPLLLLLGLATRLSALALLGMTGVIQVFVYPDAWPTHLSWAGLLLYLAARGGGRLSLDRALGLR
jgi:putative oxidoreductase